MSIQRNINFSALTFSELEEFINIVSSGSGNRFQNSDQFQDFEWVQTRFSELFQFIKVDGTTQVTYLDKYMTVPIHDLILAKLYSETSKNPSFSKTPTQPNPVTLETILSFSETKIVGLAKVFKISESLNTPEFVPPNTPTELEQLRIRVVRILKALNLIAPNPKAQIWKYRFPHNYSPEHEDKILSDLSNPGLSWGQEVKLSQYTSQYIVNQVPKQQDQNNSKQHNKPKHGDLFLNVETQQMYILNEDRLEDISDDTFMSKFQFPIFSPDYWSNFGVVDLAVNWSQIPIEAHLNLRGPIHLDPSEYRTFFRFNQRIYNLAIIAKTGDQAKHILNGNINRVKYREDGYLVFQLS